MNEVELGWSAFWLLTTVGLLCGIGSGWAFRAFANITKIRLALDRVFAHMLEIQLFSDEPKLVMRAQWQLIAANGRFLREIIRPSLVLLIPFALVLIAAHATFGLAPLQAGRPALVTMNYKSDHMPPPGTELNAPRGISVETPALRVPRLDELSWRIRPARATEGVLRIHLGQSVLTKTVSSSPGLQWLSGRRPGSFFGFLRQPVEPYFSDNIASGISVEYPTATVLNQSWIVWFSLAFCAGALVFALLARLVTNSLST
jgi:hypothetical protein